MKLLIPPPSAKPAAPFAVAVFPITSVRSSVSCPKFPMPAPPNSATPIVLAAVTLLPLMRLLRIVATPPTPSPPWAAIAVLPEEDGMLALTWLWSTVLLLRVSEPST